MKHLYPFILIASMTITACGGSAEEEGPAGGETPVSVAQPTPTQSDTGNTTNSASDIAVPTGFDFSTNKVLPVMVSLNSSFPDKMYLTVCHALPQSSGSTAQSDLDSCLTRAPVVNGQYQGEALLPNDVNTLVATLWSYEPAGVLNTYTWTRGDGPLPDLLISQ